jgi:S-adenosylmethionine:tRNA-ribosyltransferase-isomerase (queuine synthetase)
MKKLFQNYNFEFNKNEKRLLTNFCKQSIKQIEGDNKFFAETKAFNSILDKLNSNEQIIKLTKDEKTRLVHQLKQNADFLQKKIKKSWFIKKWLYRSLYSQYESMLENHFEK